MLPLWSLLAKVSTYTIVALSLIVLPSCASRTPRVRASGAIVVAKGDYVRTVRFDASGRFLAAVTVNGLGVWDRTSGQSIELPPPSMGAATAIAFCPMASLLVVGTSDEGVSIRETEGWRHLLSLQPPTPRRDPLGRRSIFAVGLTPDGSRAIAGTAGGYLHVWDSRNGDLIRHFRAHVPTPRQTEYAEPGVVQGVNALAIDRGGRWLITAGRGGAWEDRALRTWDLETGSEISGFLPPETESPGPGATEVLISPDRRVYALLLTGELWVCETGGNSRRPRASIRGDVGQDVTSIALDPHGKYVATGHGDGAIAIRDAASLKAVVRFKAHASVGVQGSDVSALAWAPSGEWIASGSWDGFIRLWSIER